MRILMLENVTLPMPDGGKMQFTKGAECLLADTSLSKRLVKMGVAKDITKKDAAPKAAKKGSGKPAKE